jgi:chromatin remodeling complex protein RSC6
LQLNNLQDKDNKEYIIADEKLKQIFHQERINLGHLNMHIKLLLENPDPIKIIYNIK